MRPIDADEVIKDLVVLKALIDYSEIQIDNSSSLNACIGKIESAPTLDVKPIVHSHWELAPEDTAYDNVWVCSNCGEDFTQHRKPKFNYCPNCGARMNEVTKNEIKKQDVFL